MFVNTSASTVKSVPVESLADWQGANVIDKVGEKLGSLEAVLYDVVLDEPAFVAVKSGTLSKKHTLVSLADAVAGRDYIRVPITKSEFKGLPTVDPDTELSAEDEENAYTFFALPYSPPAPGARRLARR